MKSRIAVILGSLLVSSIAAAAPTLVATAKVLGTRKPAASGKGECFEVEIKNTTAKPVTAFNVAMWAYDKKGAPLGKYEYELISLAGPIAVGAVTKECVGNTTYYDGEVATFEAYIESTTYDDHTTKSTFFKREKKKGKAPEPM